MNTKMFTSDEMEAMLIKPQIVSKFPFSQDESKDTFTVCICYDWNGGHRGLDWSINGDMQDKLTGDVDELVRLCTDKSNFTFSLDESKGTFLVVGEAGPSPHDPERFRQAHQIAKDNPNITLGIVERMAVGPLKDRYLGEFPDKDEDDARSVRAIEELVRQGRWRLAPMPQPEESAYKELKRRITNTRLEDMDQSLSPNIKEMILIDPEMAYVFSNRVSQDLKSVSVPSQGWHDKDRHTLIKLIEFEAHNSKSRRAFLKNLGLYEGRGHSTGLSSAQLGSKAYQVAMTLAGQECKQRLGRDLTDSLLWRSSVAEEKDPHEWAIRRKWGSKVRYWCVQLWRIMRTKVEAESNPTFSLDESKPTFSAFTFDN